jgi:hypothetical protein
LTAQQVLDFVNASPGCNSYDVGVALGGDSKIAGAHLSRLASRKLIVQGGTRNSFTYGPLGWLPRGRLTVPAVGEAAIRITEIDATIANLERERRALTAYIEAFNQP